MRTAARTLRISTTTLLTASLLVTGCYTFRWGKHDTTTIVVAPEKVPKEQRVRGVPKIAAVFSGTYTSIGPQEPIYDENASFFYAGLLRKARIFDGVHAVDISTRPQGSHVKVRMERHYTEDDHAAGNLAKAAFAPGLSSYHYDLAGSMRLVLTFPTDDGSTPEIRSYEATTAARRHYHVAAGRDLARHTLFEEVDQTNFMNLLHQLRAEPRLFRAGY